MKIKKIIIFAILLLIPTTKNALSINEEDLYTNNNGIQMTEKELTNLKNLGFTNEEIIVMTEDIFEKNKNIEGEILSQTTKYYKTVTSYGGASTYSINQDITLTYSEEITEDEYNNADKENNKTKGNTNGYTETNYKKMTTSIIKNGNYYRYKNDLVWKKMPTTRSYDIQGIGFDTTVSTVPNSKYFNRIAHMENSLSSQCDYLTSSSGTWQTSQSGNVVTFLLPSDTSTKELVGLSSHMYFDVQKLMDITIITLNAYGDYKHAQKQVSASVGLNVGYEDGSFQFGASLSLTIVESYDSINTAQATWSGISW